jgi:hypothetical protein
MRFAPTRNFLRYLDSRLDELESTVRSEGGESVAKEFLRNRIESFSPKPISSRLDFSSAS